MEFGQTGKSAAGACKTSRGGGIHTTRGPLLYLVTLMGRTAGLGQRAGAASGDGIVAAARGFGKILTSPAKLWSIGEKRRARGVYPVAAPRQGDNSNMCAAACTATESQPVALANPPAESASQLTAVREEELSLHSEMNEARARADQAIAEVATLEADLASARAELKEARNHGEGALAELSSQICALRSEKGSLASDLEHAQLEVRDAQARTVSLQADLDAAMRDAQEARSQAKDAQGSYTTHIIALQSEKEAMLSDLRDAQVLAERAISGGLELEKEAEAVGSAENQVDDPQFAREQARPAEPAQEESEENTVGQSIAASEEPAWNPDGAGLIVTESHQVAVHENEAPDPPVVTGDEANAAVFSGAVERVVFARALSNLESDDAAGREAAAKAMGEIRHELSVRALVSRFHRESSADVRQECLCALTTLDAAEAIPLARGALKDSAASVRLAAVRAIYRLAGLDGVDVLVLMLRDKNEDVRRRAATCLGWLGHEPTASDLVSLLKDGNALVRQAALEALGNLKSLSVVDDVIELLDDPEESVQRAAFHELEAITGKKMGGPLPTDLDGRRLLTARWRAWREKHPTNSEGAVLATAHH